MSDPTILLLQAIEKRQDRHEEDCKTERAEANRQRENLHRKVDDGFARVDGKIDAMVAKVDGSFSKLHERINEVVKTGHADQVKTWDWRLKAAVWLLGGLVVTLLSIVGALLYGAPWAALQ